MSYETTCQQDHFNLAKWLVSVSRDPLGGSPYDGQFSMLGGLDPHFSSLARSRRPPF